MMLHHVTKLALSFVFVYGMLHHAFTLLVSTGLICVGVGTKTVHSTDKMYWVCITSYITIFLVFNTMAMSSFSNPKPFDGKIQIF